MADSLCFNSALSNCFFPSSHIFATDVVINGRAQFCDVDDAAATEHNTSHTHSYASSHELNNTQPVLTAVFFGRLYTRV